LHIAPSIASTFKREFNQAKSTNDIIKKNQRVIEIASRSHYNIIADIIVIRREIQYYNTFTTLDQHTPIYIIFLMKTHADLH
jgi:hypothetical protein